MGVKALDYSGGVASKRLHVVHEERRRDNIESFLGAQTNIEQTIAMSSPHVFLKLLMIWKGFGNARKFRDRTAIVFAIADAILLFPTIGNTFFTNELINV